MSKLFSEIQVYIKNKQLFSFQDTILIALSGGADSMLLLYFLHKSGYKIEIAHCNFKLRGEESDLDAQFVESIAKQFKLKYHYQTFDTLEFAKENKLSIEMAARELRYEWFEKIRIDNNLQYIALAHHSDDVVETFHINLSRGSGLKGLSGIKPQNGLLVRPLLFCSRDEIMAEIKKQNILYRTDSSNLETHYTRNKFRIDAIPTLEKIYPSYKKSVIRSIQLLDESYLIVKQSVEQAKKECFENIQGIWSINILKIKQYPALTTYLFEMLNEYGINTQQARDLASNIDTSESLFFETSQYEIVKDRTHIFIFPAKQKIVEVFLNSESDAIQFPISMKASSHTIDSSFQILKEKKSAQLDLRMLKFPLKLRTWQIGDSFCPIGMKGKRKKLSDFFVDSKFSALEKRFALVLVSDNEIVWLVGHRIDDRFKIRETTQNYIQFTIHPTNS